MKRTSTCAKRASFPDSRTFEGAETLQATAQIAGAFFPIVCFVVWLVRKWKQRPAKAKSRTLAPYTGIQLLGILGILFFLMPLFLVVLSNLFRAGAMLFAFILGFLPLPSAVESFLHGGMLSFIAICLIVGMSYLCKMLWPKRAELKDNSSPRC